MSNITLVEAINLALARAMEEDDSVVVIGEDVGLNGSSASAPSASPTRRSPRD